MSWDTTYHILWPEDREKVYEDDECTGCRSRNTFFTKFGEIVCRDCWKKEFLY